MSLWSRIYERINWKDEPIEETPLSARNLNKMDAALYEIDGRVVELSGYESVVIDYSNQAKNSAANALSSETKAKTSEQNSYAYEQSALTSKNQAEVFKNEAETHANNASASERNAKLSEDNASASELLAKNSEENASDFATSASRSSENASGFAESAKTSAQNAKNSEDIAVASASSAKTDSDLAKSYTVGTHGEVRENDDTDNAKYYYEQTKSFVHGSVTGIKGEAEEEFREGNVIITKENLGLGSVENKSAQEIISEIGNATESSDGLMSKEDKVNLDGISDHVANKSNPHSVNKAQVGLGNCDNTSDADKPISTATQKALDGKSNTSHTHNYAGSSSAGGSATSAVKLDSSAGSVTKPVYFSGGKPVACKYTLGEACAYGISSAPTIGETGSVPTSHAVASALSTKLEPGNIANNLTTTSSGYALDARQGKALQDEIDTINDTLLNFNSYSLRISKKSGTFPVTHRNGGRWVALISARAHVALNYGGTSLYIASGINGMNWIELSQIIKSSDVYAPTISLSGTTFTASFYDINGGSVGVTFLCDI